jgi:hypothetical protein
LSTNLVAALIPATPAPTITIFFSIYKILTIEYNKGIHERQTEPQIPLIYF